MTNPTNAKTHVYRHQPVLPVERQLLEPLIRPGAQVLDIGCAATGRSAILARELGGAVTSIEINLDALHEFADTGSSDGIRLVGADMLDLPFAAATFDLVVVGFHGFDYLTTRDARRRALSEIDRVAKPDASLVFNGFNRLGILFTPSGLRSRSLLAQRARYVASGRFLRPTLIDYNGLELHQATPPSVIREVERSTDFRIEQTASQSGRVRRLALNTVFCSAPYYVFRRGRS